MPARGIKNEVRYSKKNVIKIHESDLLQSTLMFFVNILLLPSTNNDQTDYQIMLLKLNLGEPLRPLESKFQKSMLLAF
jgi:hypothetical protein